MVCSLDFNSFSLLNRSGQVYPIEFIQSKKKAREKKNKTSQLSERGKAAVAGDVVVFIAVFFELLLFLLFFSRTHTSVYKVIPDRCA